MTYALGTKVSFDRNNRLVRRHTQKAFERVWKKWFPIWETQKFEPDVRTGLVIGIRTLSDGKVEGGYDEPMYFIHKSHFTAYMVVFDMRRKPEFYLAEDLAEVDE